MSLILEDDVPRGFLASSAAVGPIGTTAPAVLSFIVVGYGIFQLPSAPGLYMPFGVSGPWFAVSWNTAETRSVRSVGQNAVPISIMSGAYPCEPELFYAL